MMIEILFFAGCPNHEPTVSLAREVLSELRVDAEIREVPVETPEEAETHRFVGSPTVRVNGKDIEPDALNRSDFGLSCRMYRGGGVPPKELLLDAIREGS